MKKRIEEIDPSAPTEQVKRVYKTQNNYYSKRFTPKISNQFRVMDE